MKDYETMAQSVLERRDKYVAHQRRKRKKMAATLSCFCIAALIGVGIWRTGVISNDGDTAANAMKSDNADLTVEGKWQAGASDNGGDMDGDPTGYSVKTMISSFGETKMDSDISVNNGGVLFSDALRGAMEQYGGDVEYRVIVELFSDGVALDCGDDGGVMEMERFAAEGYTVAFETYNDGYVDHNYFTLHATLEQLENFPVSEQYGYCVMLYGERLDISEETQDAMGGTAFTSGVTDDAHIQD